MAAEQEPAVAVEGLVVVRGGTRALDGLDLAVRRGAVTGLLGPNGSGKTTLMRCVVGTQRVGAGRVRVLGLPAGATPLRSRIGYLTQSPSVYADLTVRENLRYFASVLGVPRARVDRATATVALTDIAGRLAGKLSGGQRARVSLAVALLGEPELLVLDEPTVGLDPLLRRDLWTLFHQLSAAGTTVLVSSHVMDEARHCDQLVLLRDGKLLATGTPDGIQARTGADHLEDAFLRLIEREQAVRGGVK
jgi:ABC-2 type transport system ATP-binding protein